VSRGEARPLLHYADGRPEGAVVGTVSGTHWHGAFESDEFRRRFLTEAARQAGRHGFEVAPDTSFAAIRDRGLDVLGDLVEEHLDTAALWRLVESGPPGGLPFVAPGAPGG
jgi:adenosylcobyric acid synthase